MKIIRKSSSSQKDSNKNTEEPIPDQLHFNIDKVPGISFEGDLRFQ